MIRHIGCPWRPVAAVLVALLASAPVPLAASDVLQEFGIGRQQQRAMDTGAIVTADARPAMQKELTGSVAMRLPASPAELAQRIRSGLNVLADPRLTAVGRIEPAAGDAVWRAVAYVASDIAEAKRLASAQPGTEFNLSAEELAAVRARFAGQTLRAPETLELASAAWREVLSARLRAYRDNGPAGLPGYDRGESTSLPGDELRNGDVAPYVPAALRAFARAVDQFPALPPGIGSYFFWKKTEIDGRPAFVLSHVLIEERPDGVRFALREFYVSHTYNVLQQFGLATPEPDGGSTLVVINSTVTDRLPALFVSLARTIGESRSRDALEEYFASIRASLAADTSLPGRALLGTTLSGDDRSGG